MNHSPEPWEVLKSGWQSQVIRCAENRRVAELESNNPKANAHRIVACVNACKGIPDEDLQTPVLVIVRTAKGAST